MTTVLRILGALWALPPAIPIWLFYLLPFWAFGLIKPKPSIFIEGRWVVLFEAQFRYSWWTDLWHPKTTWLGHQMPFATVVTPLAGGGLIRHELRHWTQWQLLGILYPLVYGILTLFYGYEANPLEVDARKHAKRGA